MAVQGIGNQPTQVNSSTSPNQGVTLGGNFNPNNPMPGDPFAGQVEALMKWFMGAFSPPKAVDKSATTTGSASKDDIAKARAEGEAKGKADAEVAAKGAAKVADAAAPATVAVPASAKDVTSTEPYYGKPAAPAEVMSQSIEQQADAAGDSTNAIMNNAEADLTATHAGYAGTAGIGSPLDEG